mmetsp:Transcript_2844/g.5131  ORF Transcript_2844/g.5131 Transcript_2844/m.5131 type:complete len:164 (-) Transcript_2844:55-546(-)
MALLRNKNDEEEDDFFGSQEEEDGHTVYQNEFGTMAEREFLAKENELKKIGFLDAYDENKEVRLQEGFEAGVIETFDSAVRIGKILGDVTTLAKLKKLSEEHPCSTPSVDVEEHQVQGVTTSIIEFLAESFQNSKLNDEVDKLGNLEEKLKTLILQQAEDTGK